MKRSRIKQWLWGPRLTSELTLYFWFDLAAWSLLFHIDWRCNTDAVKNKYMFITLKFLCLGFEIEKWKFTEKYRKGKHDPNKNN